MPPEWMWPVDHELERWFERVEVDRAERYGGDRREAAPMIDNDLAREYRER